MFLGSTSSNFSTLNKTSFKKPKPKKQYLIEPKRNGMPIIPNIQIISKLNSTQNKFLKSNAFDSLESL